MSTSAYNDFYNNFMENKLEFVKKLQKKSSENFLLIVEELRYKNCYKDKLEVLKEIFTDDKNIFQ